MNIIPSSIFYITLFLVIISSVQAENISARVNLLKNQSEKTETIKSNSKFFEKKNTQNSIYSTFYGGTSFDQINDLVQDPDGNIYVCGATESTGSIAFNGFRNASYGGTDAFLIKFDATGKRVWGTYIGGELADIAYSVTLDPDGNIYVAGETASDDLPTSTVSHQQSYGGNTVDGFISKFKPNGDLDFITYYGGTGQEKVNSITCDAFGNLVATGFTNSDNNIATGGNLNSRQGGFDGFVAFFNPLGELRWATYAGGSDDDIHNIVFVDGDDIYVGGSTPSLDTDLTDAFQANYGGADWDAWVEKYSRSGTFQMGSYLGGTGFEEVFGIQKSGSAIAFSGYSSSRDLPEILDQLPSGTDVNAYLTYLEDGAVKWTKTIGGNSDDQSFALQAIGDKLIMAGATRGNGFPTTTNADQINHGGRIDAFWVVADKLGNIALSTFLGSDSLDVANSLVAVEEDGEYSVIIAGYSQDDDFFGKDGHQDLNRGGTDGFISLYNLSSDLFPTITISADSIFCPDEIFEVMISTTGYNDPQSVILILEDDKGTATSIGSAQIDGNGTLEAAMPSILDGRYTIYAQVENSVSSNRIPLLVDYLSSFIITSSINNEQLCQNDNIMFSTQKREGYSYKWEVQGGTILTSDTLPSITVRTEGNNNAQILEIEMTASIITKAECSDQASTTKDIVQLPDLVINGSQLVCPAVKQDYSIEKIEGWEFFWTADGGIISSANNSETVSIIWEESGFLTLYATNTLNECSFSEDYQVTVEPKPEFIISGPQETCNNCTETYFFDTDADSYEFSIENGTIMSQTDNSVTIAWSESGSDQIRVDFSASGELKCDYIEIFPVLITDEPLHNFTGPSSACLGDISQFFTNNSPDYEYEWLLETGGQIILDEGKSISVEWTLSGEHKLNLTRIRISDQFEEQITKTIEVFNTPEILDIIVPDTICQDRLFSMTISGFDPSAEYTWELPSGFLIEEDNEETLSRSLSEEGIYTVRVTATNGICSDKFVKEIVVRPTPITPTVAEMNDGLIANVEAVGYQWFKDGLEYGTDTRIINPKESGAYSVVTFNGYCFSDRSPEQMFVFKSISVYDSQIVYYDKLSLSLIITDIEILGPDSRITLYDVQGRVIHQAAIALQTPIRLVRGAYFYVISEQSGALLQSGSLVVSP